MHHATVVLPRNRLGEERTAMIPHTLIPPLVTVSDGARVEITQRRNRQSPRKEDEMDTIVVITIIAVFWLSGLLMTWSMCIVAARADRRMEERGRGCRPDDTSHVE